MSRRGPTNTFPELYLNRLSRKPSFYMYAKISYFSYRFSPPIIDDEFRYWVSQKSKNEIKKILREKSKTEWLDFFNPVTLVFILILVILCTIFPLVESKYPTNTNGQIVGETVFGEAAVDKANGGWRLVRMELGHGPDPRGGVDQATQSVHEKPAFFMNIAWSGDDIAH